MKNKTLKEDSMLTAATVTPARGPGRPRRNLATPPDAAVDIVVPDDLREFFLTAKIDGAGGFQSLARIVSARLEHSTVLHLTREEFRRVARYAMSYGIGGFQARYRTLVIEWVNQHFDELV